MIKCSDLIEDDGGFKQLEKDFDKVGKSIEDRAKELKGILSDLNIVDTGGLLKIAKEVEELKKANIQLDNVRKNSLKLQEKLNQLKEGELDDTIALRLEIQKETKERKNKITQELSLLTTYQKSSKELNELRNRYKNLRLEQGKNAKSTKDLLKQIQKLDKELKEVDAEVGQFQRNVGNYPRATQKAKAGLSSLSGFLLGVFVSNVKKSRKETRLFQSTLDKLGSASRTIFASLKELFQTSLVPIFTNLGLYIERTLLSIEKFTNGFGGDAQIEKDIQKINKKIEENSKLIKNAPSLKELFDEASDIIKTNNKALDAMLIAEAKLIDKQNLLEAQLVRLNKLGEEQQAIADDNTLSFENQQRALEESLKTKQKALSLEREIAELELTNAINRVNLNSRESGIGDVVNRQNVEKLSFLKDFNKADKIQQENIDNLVNALKRLGEVDTQVSLNRINSAKQLREIKRDQFEQELDYAIDVFDRQKYVNERLISSDKTIVTEKIKLLEETERLAESSYNNQIALTENYIKSSLKSQGKSEQEVADVLSKINIKKLAELKDESEIRKRLINSGVVDEVTQNRIKEVITERKATVQDIKDIENEINDKIKEDNQNLTTQRKEIRIAIAEEETEQKIKDFEETKKFNQEKYNSAVDYIQKEKEAKLQLIDLEEEIAKKSALTQDEITRVAEEATEKRRKLNKEVDDQIKGLDKTKLEKIKQQQKEFFNDFSSVISTIGDKVQDALQKNLNKAEKLLDKQQKAVDNQRSRAEKGLTNTLAFEQKELAKREARVLKQQKRLERVQKLQSYWKTYNANLNSLKDNESSVDAITKTLKSVAIMEGITASLASFGDGGIVADKLPSNGIFRGQSHQGNKGGIPIMVEGNEGIFSVKEMAGLGRDNFYAIKEMAGRGKFDPNFFSRQHKDFVKAVPVYPDNRNLEMAFGRVEKAIKNMPKNEFDVVKLGNAVELISKTTQGNKVTYNRFRVKRPRL